MKLADKIHQLRIDFEISISPQKTIPRFVNVILILGEKITLIDTGVKGSEEKIFDYIKHQNRDPSEIDSIILSHSHPDHMGSAAKIKELTSCTVLAHEFEIDWIENIELQNRERPVPGFFNLVDRSVKVDQNISHDHEINIGNDTVLRFFHSPGHSKGSLNILFVEDNILFTADSVPLKNDIPNYDDYHDLINSLDTIETNSDYTILLTSWTPPLVERIEIENLLHEGRTYINRIHSAVLDHYQTADTRTLDSCRATVENLGLPLFLVNPIVDKAFRSHLG